MDDEQYAQCAPSPAMGGGFMKPSGPYVITPISNGYLVEPQQGAGMPALMGPMGHSQVTRYCPYWEDVLCYLTKQMGKTAKINNREIG